MSGDTTAWQAVALSKLTRVLGERAGREALARALAETGLAEIFSSEDLRRVALALAAQGGFAGAVGGLLGVHAAMYGNARESVR